MKRSLQKYMIVIALAIMAILGGDCKKQQSSQPPVAGFNFTGVNNQVLPDTVTFSSTSRFVTTYFWSFGDGGISSAQNPVHTYTAASYTGLPYNVKLIVTSMYGRDSITRQISFVPTVIKGVSAFALPGSLITITGFGFNTSITGNTVTINGIQATVNSATATAVTVTVPANATTGPLVLTTNGRTLTTNLTVYNLVSGQALGYSGYPFSYFKHITNFHSGDGYAADGETDTVVYSLLIPEGAVGQETYLTGGYYVAPSQVRFWGLANGYAVGSNSYVIYQYGTSLYPAPTTLSVFAGSGVSGYADGQGTSAQFATPQGMTADAAGNLYVNDAHRVRKINPAGLVTTLAGSGADGNADGQGTAATFGNLYGITADAAGNVYVSDNEYLNIRKITPAGTVTTFAGSGTAGFADGAGKAAQFYFPKGMATDALGDIFVSDSNCNNTTGPYTSAIRMISPLGLVTTILNSNKGDNISNPDGIAYMYNGIVYLNNGIANPPWLLICNTGPGIANQNLVTVNFVAK